MQVNIPLIFLFHAEPCALTSHLSRHDIEKVAHPGAAGAILHPITDHNLLLSLLQGPSRKGRPCDICAHPKNFFMQSKCFIRTEMRAFSFKHASRLEPGGRMSGWFCVRCILDNGRRRL